MSQLPAEDRFLKNLDSTNELADWGFSGPRPNHCHRCGINNSKIAGLMIQCALCKFASYCSMKCFNEDLVPHQEFCRTGALHNEPTKFDTSPLPTKKAVETEKEDSTIKDEESSTTKPKKAAKGTKKSGRKNNKKTVKSPKTPKKAAEEPAEVTELSKPAKIPSLDEISSSTEETELIRKSTSTDDLLPENNQCGKGSPDQEEACPVGKKGQNTDGGKRDEEREQEAVCANEEPCTAEALETAGVQLQDSLIAEACETVSTEAEEIQEIDEVEEIEEVKEIEVVEEIQGDKADNCSEVVEVKEVPNDDDDVDDISGDGSDSTIIEYEEVFIEEELCYASGSLYLTGEYEIVEDVTRKAGSVPLPNEVEPQKTPGGLELETSERAERSDHPNVVGISRETSGSGTVGNNNISSSAEETELIRGSTSTDDLLPENNKCDNGSPYQEDASPVGKEGQNTDGGKGDQERETEAECANEEPCTAEAKETAGVQLQDSPIAEVCDTVSAEVEEVQEVEEIKKVKKIEVVKEIEMVEEIQGDKADNGSKAVEVVEEVPDNDDDADDISDDGSNSTIIEYEEVFIEEELCYACGSLYLTGEYEIVEDFTRKAGSVPLPNEVEPQKTPGGSELETSELAERPDQPNMVGISREASGSGTVGNDNDEAHFDGICYTESRGSWDRDEDCKAMEDLTHKAGTVPLPNELEPKKTPGGSELETAVQAERPKHPNTGDISLEVRGRGTSCDDKKEVHLDGNLYTGSRESQDRDDCEVMEDFTRKVGSVPLPNEVERKKTPGGSELETPDWAERPEHPNMECISREVSDSGRVKDVHINGNRYTEPRVSEDPDEDCEVMEDFTRKAGSVPLPDEVERKKTPGGSEPETEKRAEGPKHANMEEISRQVGVSGRVGDAYKESHYDGNCYTVSQGSQDCDEDCKIMEDFIRKAGSVPISEEDETEKTPGGFLVGKDSSNDAGEPYDQVALGLQKVETALCEQTDEGAECPDLKEIQCEVISGDEAGSGNNENLENGCNNGTCSRCGSSTGVKVSKGGSFILSRKKLTRKTKMVEYLTRKLRIGEEGVRKEREPFVRETVDLKEASPIPKREYEEPQPFQGQRSALKPMHDSTKLLCEHVPPFLDKRSNLKKEAPASPKVLRRHIPQYLVKRPLLKEAPASPRELIQHVPPYHEKRTSLKQTNYLVFDRQKKAYILIRGAEAGKADRSPSSPTAARDAVVLKPVPESPRRHVEFEKPEWVLKSPIRKKGGLDLLLNRSSSHPSPPRTTNDDDDDGGGGDDEDEILLLEDDHHELRCGRRPTHHHPPTTSPTQPTSNAVVLRASLDRSTPKKESKMPSWALKSPLRTTDRGIKIKSSEFSNLGSSISDSKKCTKDDVYTKPTRKSDAHKHLSSPHRVSENYMNSMAAMIDSSYDMEEDLTANIERHESSGLTAMPEL